MWQCPAPIINLPPSTGHEWLKILTSAFVGLLSGVLLEPLKRKLQWEHDMTKMLKAVLTDYEMLSQTLDGLAEREPNANSLQMPAFEYYWESRRELFYDTFELQFVYFHVRALRAYAEMVKLNGMDKEDLCRELRGIIREAQAYKLETSTLKRIWRRLW